MSTLKRLPGLILLIVFAWSASAQDDPFIRFQQLFQEPKPADLKVELAHLIRDHPETYVAYLSLTGLFLEEGRTADDLESFLREHTGNHPFALPMLMGIFLRDQGNGKAARQWFAKATEIPPSQPLLGLLLVMNPDLADQTLERVVPAAELDENARTILRTLYAERKPATTCANAIRKRYAEIGTESDPVNIMQDTYNYLLLLMLEDTSPPDVLEAWESSRARDLVRTQYPSLIPTLNQVLFRVFTDLQDRGKSQEVLIQGLQLANRYHCHRWMRMYRHWLAEAQAREGRIPEAVSMLKEELAFARKSGNIEDQITLLRDIGRFYSFGGMSELGVEPYSEALELAKGNFPRYIPFLQLKLAYALLESGDLPAAEEIVRLALETNTYEKTPSDISGFQQLLCRIQFEKGEIQQGLQLAHSHYEKALKKGNTQEQSIYLALLMRGYRLSEDACLELKCARKSIQLAEQPSWLTYLHLRIYELMRDSDCDGALDWWPLNVFRRLSHIRKAVQESDKVNVDAFQSLPERYEFLSNTVKAHRLHAEAMGDVARTVGILAGAILGVWLVFFLAYQLWQWRSRNMVGPYLIKAQVGEGGMGDVFRAVSMETRQEVALKILKIPVTGSPQKIRRFKDEIKILSRLDHPNILQYYDSGEHRGKLYLATEFLDGETLEAKLEREWPLPMEFCLYLIDDMLAGLAYLHDKGVLHRDIKPANIMVASTRFSITHPTSRGGRIVKLMDFGIAKEIGTDSQTQALEIVGTPAYIAPETLTMSVTSAQTDIYSLGITLYRLFTGVLPYQHHDPMVVQHQILNPDIHPVRPSQMLKSFPRQLEELIMNCVAHYPRDRYRSIADVRTAFNTCKEQVQPS